MSAAFEGITNFSLKPGLGKPEYEKIKFAATNAELVILSFFVQRDRYVDHAPVTGDDLKLIQNIIDAKPGKVIAVSFGNPFVINKIEAVPAFFACYGEGGWFGNQPVYFNSFIQILKGQLIPSGKLPVLVAPDYPIGFGLTY